MLRAVLAQNPSTVGVTGKPIASSPKSTVPIYVAICCLVIVLALVLGVGLAANEVLRHLVQTAPLWVGIALGFRGSNAAYWVALPSFLVWLVLMALIWAYLLGISRIVTGHFSPIEVGMTIIVGAASILGILSFVSSRSSFSSTAKLALFVGFLAIQLICLRISFLPSIAHR